MWCAAAWHMTRLLQQSERKSKACSVQQARMRAKRCDMSAADCLRPRDQRHSRHWRLASGLSLLLLPQSLAHRRLREWTIDPAKVGDPTTHPMPRQRRRRPWPRQLSRPAARQPTFGAGCLQRARTVFAYAAQQDPLAHRGRTAHLVRQAHNTPVGTTG